MAAYASEINRLKALVTKLQRMQFGKSSEKLREKTQRQVRQSSARKPLPASLPQAAAAGNDLSGVRRGTQCSGL